MTDRELSSREMEIVRLAVDGASNKETANKLGITDATVKVHRKAIMRKIGAKNIQHVVAIAFRKGWVQ